MKLKVQDSYSEKIYTLDTKKKYTLIFEITLGAYLFLDMKPKTQIDKIRARIELRKYCDEEGYGTDYHYGYVFVTDKILRKESTQTYPKDFQLGTLPDLVAQIKGVSDLHQMET